MPVPSSYAHGSTGTPLSAETIGQALDRALAAHPGREALVDVPSGRRWTYERLGRDVDALARGLLRAGVAKGDRVGIWAANCPEWVLVQYAAARIGAILVTLNPAYRTDELAYVLGHAGVGLLVAQAEYRGSDHRAMAAEAAGRCPALREAVWIGEPSWDALSAPAPEVHRDDLHRDGLHRDGLHCDGLHCDEPIGIQYTSGTTGHPKGVTLSHRNILNNGRTVGALLGYTEQDRICVPVPFYHCFGMVVANLAALAHGACVVIPAPWFDPAATLYAVAAERATSLYGVPTMFIAELGLPDLAAYDLSSLRTGLMGATPCPVEVMKRVLTELHMPEVAIAYGMTETSPVSTMTRRDDDLEHRTATVGTVLPHVETRVADPVTGLTVPRGEAGELCTRGYSVMLGYWDDPVRTAEAVDADGWLHSGDLAVMRPDGYVTVVGRIKDMIIRGGENVSPREIEEFLHSHPGIADVQVVGVPHPALGEEICACVILHDPADGLTPADLAAFCGDRLARYKTPRFVHVVDAFPMTVSGKVRKIDLRVQAARALGLAP